MTKREVIPPLVILVAVMVATAYLLAGKSLFEQASPPSQTRAAASPGSIATSAANVRDPFAVRFKGFDLQLNAPDQVEAKVSRDFCGGNLDRNTYEGTYQIIARKADTAASAISIGPKEFIAETPHDGLRVVNYQPTGEQFIAVTQYENCNSDSASFYTINSANQLVNVPFLANGTSVNSVPTRSSGLGASIDGTFCGYDETAGIYLCDAYQYRNYAFVRMDSWLVNGPETGSEQVATDIGRAERYLFELCSSDKIRGYLPHDAHGIDEIHALATSAPSYKFQINFGNHKVEDYKYVFQIEKTADGFRTALPPVTMR